MVKKLPLECEINTYEESAISWNRPIKNHMDKKDFERLEKYDFAVKYRQGVDMIAADALSRSVEPHFEVGKEDEKTKILKMHVKLNHRKTIHENLNSIGVNVSKEHLNRILLG
jgi:hypothetical protein